VAGSIKNKAILIIDLQGAIGGAQKRNLVLANYILKQRSDFHLLVNDKLYYNYQRNQIIDPHPNISIIKLDKASYAAPNAGRSIISMIHTDNKKIKVPTVLGKIKKALRLALKWFRFSFQLGKIVTSKNIRIIYAIWMGGMWVWPFKKILNFKLIYGYNDADLSWIKKSPLDFFDSEYWVLKYCDKVDFLSEGLMKRFDDEIYKVEPTRKSFSPCSFIIYDKYYPVYPKRNQIVFLGRLHKDRNPMLILNAIEVLQKYGDIKDYNFYFIGDGALKNDIKSFIAEKGLKNTQMLGSIFDPWKYLQLSKIFITVANENYPSQSLLEAMACENAIIASNVGETEKLVSKNEGVLVNLNAEEIAAALQELINNPDLSQQLGKNSRKKALSEHNIDRYTKYFYALFQN